MHHSITSLDTKRHSRIPPGFEPVPLKKHSFLFVNKDRVKALDQHHKHDGKILLFTDSFFAKSNEDSKYLHSTILFNDLLNIPVIDVETTLHCKSSSSNRK